MKWQLYNRFFIFILHQRCTNIMENVNLNTEMHSHFTYCIVILYITFQIEYCYPYAFISFDCIFDWINAALVQKRLNYSTFWLWYQSYIPPEMVLIFKWKSCFSYYKTLVHSVSLIFLWSVVLYNYRLQIWWTWMNFCLNLM